MTIEERKRLYEERHCKSALEESSEPYILFKEMDEIKGTPQSNFEAQVRNAQKVNTYTAFDSFDEVKEYLLKYAPGTEIIINEKIITEAAEDTTTPEIVPTVDENIIDNPNEGIATGIANSISALIQDEWEAIDGYKNAIAMLQTLTDTEDLVVILNEVLTDEYNHVGALQKALTLINPEATNIAKGELEAEKELGDNI